MRSVELVGVEGGRESLSVDALELATCGASEGLGGDSVDVSEATGGGFVEEREGVSVEEVLRGTGDSDVVGEVLGGVLGAGIAEVKAGVNTRVEQAIAAQTQSLVKLGNTDEGE